MVVPPAPKSQKTAAGGEEDGFPEFSMEAEVQTGASWVMKSTRRSDVYAHVQRGLQKFQGLSKLTLQRGRAVGGVAGG